MRRPNLICVITLAAGLGACGAPRTEIDQAVLDPVSLPPVEAPIAAPLVEPVLADAVEKSLLGAPCFLSNEEASAIIAAPIVNQVPFTRDLESGGVASCRYEGERNTLVVNLTWIDPVQLSAWKAYQNTGLAGTVTALPGDPDGAQIQVQPDLGGAINYIRKNVQVEVRPMTWTGTSNDVWTERLTAARRFP